MKKTSFITTLIFRKNQSRRVLKPHITAPHWIVHHYYYGSPDIIDCLQTYLHRYKFVGLSVSMNDGVEHGAVICRTDQGDVIADSYIRLRRAEWRPITHSFWSDLHDLIMDPSITKWNELWKCREKHHDILELGEIELDYHDPTLRVTHYRHLRTDQHDEITIQIM